MPCGSPRASRGQMGTFAAASPAASRSGVAGDAARRQDVDHALIDLLVHGLLRAARCRAAPPGPARCRHGRRPRCRASRLAYQAPTRSATCRSSRRPAAGTPTCRLPAWRRRRGRAASPRRRSAPPIRRRISRRAAARSRSRPARDRARRARSPCCRGRARAGSTHSRSRRARVPRARTDRASSSPQCAAWARPV